MQIELNNDAMAGAIQPPVPLDTKVESILTTAENPVYAGTEDRLDAGVHVDEQRVVAAGIDAAEATGQQHAPDEQSATGATKQPEHPEYGLPIHPLCDLFPPMGDKQFDTLTADIGTNGLLNPVVVYEGQVVDGRHRLLACRKAGVEPRTVEWREVYKGDMPLSRWIWSVNAERRHLTADQIAMAYVAMHLWEDTEAAKQRQIEAGRQQAEHGKDGGRGNKKALPMDSPEGVSPATGSSAKAEPGSGKDRSGEVCVKLANEIGVSEHKARQAKKVQEADPELGKRVIAGETTLRAAVKQVGPKLHSRAAAKRGESAGGPEKAMKRNEVGFDLDKAISAAMKSVDKVLESIPDEQHDAFLDEMIRTLERMK